MSQRPISEEILSEALPHLIRRELRRQTARPEGSGCPDADALAAFVEQHLDRTEKQAIVEHLNACQPCRMSVVFAMRAGRAAGATSSSETTLPTAASRSPFLPWGVAGGIAAGLLAAFVLFWQRPPAPRKTAALVQQASLQMPAPVAHGDRAALPPFPLPPAHRMYARVPARPAATSASAPALTAARSAPPVTAPKSSSPAPIRQGFATLTPSHAPQSPVLPGMEVASTSLNSDGPASASPPAGNSLPAGGSGSFAAPIPMASSFLGSSVMAQPHASLVSSDAPMSSDRLGFSQFLAQGSARPVWRISSGGVLEHAAARGAWVRVPLQAAGRLVSLTVSGAHLWAVSQAGILYHSADSGQSWHPVHVDLDRHAMQDAIVGVHFADQQQGELITRSGAHWFTVDGGHFWRPVIAPSLTPDTGVRH